jgi:hypothetical protein
MRFFKRTDIIVILLILAVSAISWTIYKNRNTGRPVKAEIYYYSELVETIDLSTAAEGTFSISPNQDVVFEIDNKGNISFIKSDCPDKICINAGKLHLAGQSAACLPNGIVVRIVPLDGWKDKDVDVEG